MKIGVMMPELLRALFKKPATVDYPFVRLAPPPDFRGSPFLKPELCIACLACERDCPAEAIEILSTNEAEKRFMMTIHIDRCIHCAQCVDSCPTDAMAMDMIFEIADVTRLRMKKQWEYVRATVKIKPPPAKPPASPAPA